MKKSLMALLLIALSFYTAPTSNAQTLKHLFNKISGKNNHSNNKEAANGSNLSNFDISSGLKEALKIGAQNATQQLSAKDGFFKDAAVKILLPKEAREVEQTLRSLGMASLVDQAVLLMNRAAEDAAIKAAPIFLNAITGITINDGLSILQGGNTAATQYLKSRTTVALTDAFRPVIQSSLDKVGADKIWNTVFSTYNKLPLIRNKVNPDLVSYVTEQALDGLFKTIAQEEMEIRTDPAAQVTGLLRKVFGNN